MHHQVRTAERLSGRGETPGSHAPPDGLPIREREDYSPDDRDRTGNAERETKTGVETDRLTYCTERGEDGNRAGSESPHRRQREIHESQSPVTRACRSSVRLGLGPRPSNRGSAVGRTRRGFVRRTRCNISTHYRSPLHGFVFDGGLLSQTGCADVKIATWDGSRHEFNAIPLCDFRTFNRSSPFPDGAAS